jgi:hypothetical protein
MTSAASRCILGSPSGRSTTRIPAGRWRLKGCLSVRVAAQFDEEARSPRGCSQAALLAVRWRYYCASRSAMCPINGSW